MEETAHDPIVLQLLLQAALIAVNAVFACAEIALISINPVRLEKTAREEKPDKNAAKARRLLSLIGKPAKFLATIQVGITLAGFLGSAFAAENFAGKLSSALGGLPFSARAVHAVSLVAITLALSLFTLVLGELVPKRLAMHRAEQIAFAFSGFILFISKVFAPVVWLLTKTTNGLLRLFGIRAEAEEQAVTEEEIRLLLEAGSERGSIAEGDREIINNVFEFGGKTAEEVMTHRRDAVILWLKDGDGEWEKTIVDNTHGSYPVCGKGPDDIRGVLRARDYLVLKERRRETVLRLAVRPAWLVPNTLPAKALFARMKERRNHFALVIDEYGGMDGIVTMKDLLEELVGDLAENEADAEKAPIEKIARGIWRVNGSASLDRLAKETGAPLPVNEYDTFAGFVFTLLGRIPGDGERVEIENSGLLINVTDMKNRRLESATVRLKP